MEIITPNLGEAYKSETNQDFRFEDLDIDFLLAKTLKQFIIDASTSNKFHKQFPSLVSKINELKKTKDEEIENFLSESGLYKIFFNYDVLEKIEEAYHEIIEYLNEGEFPVITFDPIFLKKVAKEGIDASCHHKTFDGQNLIAGTIGRNPLNKEGRVVARIKNVKPEDITPRSTGKFSCEEFNFNGVIIFQKKLNPIDIEIISFPDELYSKIKTPINSKDFLNKIN